MAAAKKFNRYDLKPKRSARWELWRGGDGLWYFHLKAANGEIQHVSEGYTRKANCRKGIGKAIKNAATAEIVELAS